MRTDRYVNVNTPFKLYLPNTKRNQIKLSFIQSITHRKFQEFDLFFKNELLKFLEKFLVRSPVILCRPNRKSNFWLKVSFVRSFENFKKFDVIFRSCRAQIYDSSITIFILVPMFRQYRTPYSLLHRGICPRGQVA